MTKKEIYEFLDKQNISYESRDMESARMIDWVLVVERMNVLDRFGMDHPERIASMHRDDFARHVRDGVVAHFQADDLEECHLAWLTMDDKSHILLQKEV